MNIFDEKTAQMIKNTNKLLKEYVGGKLFFDKLDESVKLNTEFLKQWVETIPEYVEIKGKWESRLCLLVSSGEIGKKLVSMGLVDFSMTSDCTAIVVLVGGYPRNVEIKYLNQICQNFQENKTSKYIFIDDSYYSGNTEKKIELLLKPYGISRKHTYVFYDGNPFQDETRTAIYRYWNKN